MDEHTVPMEDKCEEYLAGWKRAQADYLNLKRETERDRQQFAAFANERLLTSLLPAIDQFELAMTFTPDLTKIGEDEQRTFNNWLSGLKAVQSGWERALSDIGVERIPTDGAFDPQIHEAVGEEVAEGATSGTILRTIQSGWRLNGKILRPAKVILTK